MFDCDLLRVGHECEDGYSGLKGLVDIRPVFPPVLGALSSILQVTPPSERGRGGERGELFVFCESNRCSHILASVRVSAVSCLVTAVIAFAREGGVAGISFYSGQEGRACVVRMQSKFLGYNRTLGQCADPIFVVVQCALANSQGHHLCYFSSL